MVGWIQRKSGQWKEKAAAGDWLPHYSETVLDPEEQREGRVGLAICLVA